MLKIVEYTIPLLIGLVAGFLPNIISNKYNEKCLRRDKQECLYESITKWYNRFFGQVQYFILVLDNKIDWNQYLDYKLETNKESNFLKNEIIVNIYFPKISKPLNELTTSMQSLYNFIEDEIKESYIKGRNISLYKEKVFEKLMVCNNLCEKLKNDIKNLKI